MSTEKILNKLKSSSKRDTTWLKQAKWRQENKEWLDFSFDVAVKIMSKLKSNKTFGLSPKNQKEFAELMGRTPQYVNKLLKGTENLQIKTIKEIERVLDINLIEVPKSEAKSELDKFFESFETFEYLYFDYKDVIYNSIDDILSSLEDNIMGENIGYNPTPEEVYEGVEDENEDKYKSAA